MLILAIATVFAGAALLFVIEPMFARMMLPQLGGSPAVWNTALVFYQVALLAGYAWAGALASRLKPRGQAIAHLALVVAALACLPIAVPAAWTPPVDHNPIPWLLGVMALRVGLPFVAVAATGPLVQVWFADTRHRLARDPYFLYAASNLGSMLGLASYPLLIEPHLTLAAQRRAWSFGYAALVALVAGCALARLVAVRGGPAMSPAEAGEPSTQRATAANPDTARLPRPVVWPRRLRWAALAFAPASLMMSVTTLISTDIAAIPLLWILPLSVYLGSFVIVFARRPLLTPGGARAALPWLIGLALAFEQLGQPLGVVVAVHLVMLGAAAIVCHGELAADRPNPAHLPEFYLWLSAGGALGGVFNAIVAPLVFRSVLEYPIALVLVCALSSAERPAAHPARARLLDVALPLGLALLALVGAAALAMGHIEVTRAHVALWFVLAAPVLFAFVRRPARFALGLAALLVTEPGALETRRALLHAERSFFGVSRVVLDATGTLHEFRHGTTLHGTQRIHPLECRVPTTYYRADGPIGDVFAARTPHVPDFRVGVAGLGAGTLAAYAAPGDTWTFYEIDPVVARISRNPRWFCYLSACAQPPRIVLGDARLSLARSGDRYDVLVLDAYSSDAVPVHMLTREALRTYLDHLKPGGVCAFHISNRFFELAPIVAGLARDAGAVCRVARLGRASRVSTSEWAVVVRDPRDLGSLAGWGNWSEVALAPGARTWTDDYSSLFSVLRRPGSGGP